MKLGTFFKVIAILAILLPAFAGCDNGTGGGDGDDLFIGNWSGTVSYATFTLPATIDVTASGWDFNCPVSPPISETGTYILDGNNATLIQEGDTFGTASLSGGTLSVSITAGEYAGAEGTFTK
jgi:hypothetical protein